jgi:5S rRNA maturation endonuclease (ribonuclease M5)
MLRLATGTGEHMKNIGELLNKLKGVKSLSKGEYAAICPAHDDKKPSLNFKLEGDKILLKCQAGCSIENIVSALGYQMSDLFIKDEAPINTPAPQSKITATYEYKDETGKPLFEVVRYEPKSFRQRHKNGNGEYKWEMDGIRRVLYHLDELVKITNDTIYIVEGEKDADNLWSHGKIATTSPGGANNWKPEYANSLAGKKICVIPDKDSSGYNYAKDVIRSLDGKASDIKVVILPGEGIKDVSDWLLMDNDVEQLTALEQDVSILLDPDKPIYIQKDEYIIWRKPLNDLFLIFQAEKLSNEKTGTHAKITIKYDYIMLGWSYFNIERSEDRTRLANAAYSQLKGDMTKTYTKDDLRRDFDSFCSGLWKFYVATFTPELMYGDEVQEPLKFLLNPYSLDNGGTILYAPPGRGKSYTGLLWAQSIHNGVNKLWRTTKTPVLFINLERSKYSLGKRLANVNRVLGIQPTTPIHCINARGKTLYDVADTCREYIKKYNIGIIFLDSISRAGLGDLNDNQSMNKIIDTLSSICPSWVALSHTSRANEDHAFGSIMADAGADICIQLSSQILEDNTLGIGWEITKTNDTGKRIMEINALTFNEYGLQGIRKAKPYEFPEIEGKRKTDLLSQLIDYVTNQESSDSNATDAADELMQDQGNISRLFLNSGKFIKTRKVGRSIYYGVKDGKHELLQ